MNTPNLTKAITEWKEAIGDNYIIDNRTILEAYEKNAGGLKREIPAVLCPATTQEVQRIVQIANEYTTPLYPISRGKNWGLGSKLPVKDNTVVVDLGRMNKIREINSVHGYVVVEPGVTQMQLYEFLKDSNIPFIFGVTGSGAESSVLGNALEKGGEYFYCRFERISGLEVVLGNGDLIKTGFGHYSGAQNTHNFKYGIGPYLDGLFAQSNFGIVTSAGIDLMPIREVHCAFKCSIYDEKAFPQMVDRFAELRRTEVIPTAAHIANDHRTLNALSPAIYDYLRNKKKGNAKELRQEAEELCKKLATPWSIAGGLIGTKRQVKEAQRQIKKAMKGIGEATFIDKNKLKIAKRFIRLFGFIPQVKRLDPLVYAIEPVLDIMVKGKPSDLSIKTVYWPIEETPEDWREPDNSKSGLLFSLPMIPNQGKIAQHAVRLTKEIFRKYGFIPYITMNMLTPTGLEGVINNAFDRENPEQVRAAHECIRELNSVFLEEGLIPYRVGIESMDIILNKEDTFWQTIRDLKQVLDPNNIISPGRYNLI